MWMVQVPVADQEHATDSCLTGMGGLSGTDYLHEAVPECILDRPGINIAHLELLAIIICLRKWGHKFEGKRFVMLYDNQAVMNVINAGSAREKFMQHLMRLFAYVCAMGQFEVVAQYIKSEENRIPDLLSRIHLRTSYQEQFQKLKQAEWQRTHVEISDWNINEIW